MDSTSIMVVTYNRLALTKQTLDNLFKNTLTPYHLVIIDNASSDGTVEYLESFFSEQKSDNFLGYKIIKNKENRGIAIGRNQGLLHSYPEDDWLCTLDNDVLVSENWLGKCIDVLKANRNYGMIGLNMENNRYPIVNLNGQEFQRKPQGNLGTACAVFPRTLHKMIGFFNTEYGLYGEEDSDFGFRARVVGYQLGYIKENGTHLGEGENDVGAYREFKTKCHKDNLAKFNANCRAYANRLKPVYIQFYE